jgi:hypothetical protein
MNEKEENRLIRKKIDQGVRLAIAEAVRSNDDLWIRGSEYGGISELYLPKDEDILIDIIKSKYQNNLNLQNLSEQVAKASKVAEFNLGLALRRRKEFLAVYKKVISLSAPDEQCTFEQVMANDPVVDSQMEITGQFNGCFLLGFIALESFVELVYSVVLSNKIKQLLKAYIEAHNTFDNRLNQSVTEFFNQKESQLFISKEKILLNNQNVSFIKKFTLLLELCLETTHEETDPANSKLLSEKTQTLENLIDLRNSLVHTRARVENSFTKILTFIDKEAIAELDELYKWFVKFLFENKFIDFYFNNKTIDIALF